MNTTVKYQIVITGIVFTIALMGAGWVEAEKKEEPEIKFNRISDFNQRMNEIIPKQEQNIQYNRINQLKKNVNPKIRHQKINRTGFANEDVKLISISLNDIKKIKRNRRKPFL